MTTRRLKIYYITVLALSISVFYAFQEITSKHPSDYLYFEKSILCAISSFFNLFVLWFHFTHAPHPKFVILTIRKISIYTHIISGVIEFVTCWIAFWTGNANVARAAALVTILGHVPSAYYQTSIVFGAKALMVAGYLFAISLHLFSAVHLLLEPTSVYWLLNMFLVHNIYVWCRVFIGFFGATGLFRSTNYTSSICFSGLLLFPAVLGVTGNLLFIVYVATCIILYFTIVKPTELEKDLYVRERTRELLINKELYQSWINTQLRMAGTTNGPNCTDKLKAKQVFDALDSDKSGYLDGSEVQNLLQQWKVAPSLLKRFDRKEGVQVSFDEFYKYIWRVGDISIQNDSHEKHKTDAEKAMFIFKCLDADGSGYIEAIEMQKLLIQWGLPENEVDDYLSTDEDKRYSFDEFFTQQKVIWDFAYDNIGVSHEQQANEPIAHHNFKTEGVEMQVVTL